MKKNIIIWILSLVSVFAVMNLLVIKHSLDSKPVSKQSFKVYEDFQNESAKLKNIKPVLWELVSAQVEDKILSFEARVDTWAQTSSIHAENLKIENSEDKQKDNIGKNISFEIINNSGQKEKITKQIVDVRSVKTSEWSELRYYVMMHIQVAGRMKNVLVNLNDRDDMNFKLLLGRNFLSEDYLIEIKK